MTLNSGIFAFFLLYLVLHILYLFKVKAFKMNAEPLTHQQLFKAAIIIPIVSFLMIGFICWREYDLKLDADGFNKFIEISKLPLGLLSLSIPFGVVVNNIHRTIQTDKQIKEAERKNKADGFYSHRKNTIEMFESLPFKSFQVAGEKYTLEFDNCYSTYRYSYPMASTSCGEFIADENFVRRVDNLWIALKEKLENPPTRSAESTLKYIASIENILDNMHRILLFKPIEIKKLLLVNFSNEEGFTKRFVTKFSCEDDIKMAINAYWNACMIITQALELDINEGIMIQSIAVEHYSLNSEKILRNWGVSVNDKINHAIPGIY
ncbi:hypothetical protein [Leclercia sp. LSNIH1]|uniref:hypothetical protein n=1 Tax=Leclercia sp. LSNIH1 TaxID=1920114 RepID=UPI000CD21E95|nr:hypothetical protein [Leclercia sp. LSNIH1]AUU86169.1 hypothetical protein C2U54_20080 [Leclercia sp. LSNIH1]POV36463.1 hypothetical protein C3388_04100 [Leclercia sp. LSNIH5]POW68593.1 hypothetical protein C3389_02345 [Leclercia sp. LSNIH2]